MFKKIYLITIILLISGCSNNMYSFSYNPINREYQKELFEIETGMSKYDVLKIFNGKIYPRGQNNVNGKIIDALELQHNYWAGIGGSLIKEEMWFYFYDGRLIKWGYPNDWPESPDIIIEKRIR